MTQVDSSKIIPPNITFSEFALEQLHLIGQQDFTLKGKYFRIVISGKGCDGFTYSVGFTDIHEDDLLVTVNDGKTQVLVDPFTAFYLGNTKVEYMADYDNDQEGFVVINQDQKKYSGKFWRGNPSSVPPVIA